LKKILSAFIALTLVIVLAGCGSKTSNNANNQELLTINGEAVSVSLFISYLETARMNVETQYNTSGASDFWQSASIDGESANDYAKGQALLNIENLYVTKQQLNRALTSDEQAKVQNLKDIYKNTYGNQYTEKLAEQGLTPEANDLKLTYTAYDEIVYNQMKDNTTDAQFRDFYQNDMLLIKQIMISKKDKNGAALTGDALAAAQSKAQSVEQQAQSGVDFDALITDDNEDSTMASNPDGILITKTNPSYSTIWMDTATGLADNAISDIFDNGDGWYILKRLPIDLSTYSNNYEFIKREYWINQQYEWRTAANVVKNDELWNSIDVSKGLSNNFGI